MSAIFHHAMRYEWTDRNPIKLLRQSAKREKVPDVLELAELQLLLSKLSVRERTLALLDAATGLRVSELLALRWQDVDFENLELKATRSIWHQVVGDCKTEASVKPVSNGQLHGGGPSALASSEPVPDGRGLGLRKSDRRRQAAVLA
ncbi:tyrosine-type recombinase/integrase [Granulicella arctica]|uniref:tyrosine-type recombinase/integrase n=1 Tax=Granulicella arctica TaxID=940613 RepID=UPI0021DF7A50|nr:tyrosine-type recombinase/integrase [Granulicella arctica]